MRHAGAGDAEGYRGGRLAETNQVALGARPRREALRPDVKRLEQVRLAGAVLADHEDDAGRQREVECRIRAKVS
jgi:hypothetical protein